MDGRIGLGSDLAWTGLDWHGSWGQVSNLIYDMQGGHFFFPRLAGQGVCLYSKSVNQQQPSASIVITIVIDAGTRKVRDQLKTRQVLLALVPGLPYSKIGGFVAACA